MPGLWGDGIARQMKLRYQNWYFDPVGIVVIAAAVAALFCGCSARPNPAHEFVPATAPPLPTGAIKAQPSASASRRPAGYSFTVPPGYVYFVRTNSGPWTTNGPLPVYFVTEYQFHGDMPHQCSTAGIFGPWDTPASNSFIWKWSADKRPAFILKHPELFFRGHVAVTNYFVTLPVFEVSYAQKP